MYDEDRLHERNREEYICIFLSALDSSYAVDAIWEVGQDEVFTSHHNPRISDSEDEVWKGCFAGKYPRPIPLLITAGY